MRTAKYGLALALLIAAIPSCGDDDGESSPGTGGRAATGGSNTGGVSSPTGGRGQTTGGRNASEGGAEPGGAGPVEAGAGGEGNSGGTEPQGGTPGDAGGAGGEAGSGIECNRVRDFVPPSEADDPGPACQAYGECMNDGCGELYEPAFGADWASGDLSGGACGPAVPCFEGCGCDEACLLGCVLTAPECAVYAGQFQGCVEACADDALACNAERNP
jgi:hypothetical protein